MTPVGGVWMEDRSEVIYMFVYKPIKRDKTLLKMQDHNVPYTTQRFSGFSYFLNGVCVSMQDRFKRTVCIDLNEQMMMSKHAVKSLIDQIIRDYSKVWNYSDLFPLKFFFPRE